MNNSKVYYEMELQYDSINVRCYEDFIRNFYAEIGFSLDDFIPAYVDITDISKKFAYIRYLVLVYLKKYKDIFYNLLYKSGYNMSLEVIDSLVALCDFDGANIDNEVLNLVLKSPYVQNLKINGDKIKLISDEFGSFDVMSVKSYFKNDRDAYNLFTFGDVSHRCHSLSMCLLDNVEGASIVTSLLPSYFVGTYYHTYLENNAGLIIDGANQIVLPKEQYERLFKVKKVVSSKKSELFAQYVDAVSDGRILTSDGYYIPLALALSKGIR